MEMMKTTATIFADKEVNASFTMKEFCILNIEKQSAPQVILRSGNFERDDIPLRKESLDNNNIENSGLFELEEEDKINEESSTINLTLDGKPEEFPFKNIKPKKAYLLMGGPTSSEQEAVVVEDTVVSGP